MRFWVWTLHVKWWLVLASHLGLHVRLMSVHSWTVSQVPIRLHGVTAVRNYHLNNPIVAGLDLIADSLQAILHTPPCMSFIKCHECLLCCWLTCLSIDCKLEQEQTSDNSKTGPTYLCKLQSQMRLLLSLRVFLQLVLSRSFGSLLSKTWT